MKKLLIITMLMFGLQAGVLPAVAQTETAPTEQSEDSAKRQKAAAKWVKKEMADAKKAAGLLKKVKNSSSCRSVERALRKLLAPYEEYYGNSVMTAAPANIRLPKGVQGPDLSRLEAAKPAKLPAGLTRDDIRAEQRKMAKQRKKIADLVAKNHKLVDQAVRANYSTCGGTPTNDMDTAYIDSAAHFVMQYMCSQP